jgi:nucleotide-binding universal stress UspA family protein
MFKKILVPWDGSELAGKILPEVEEIAKCFQAELVLFNVGSLSSVTRISEMMTFKEIEEFSAQMKSATDKDMSSMAEEMTKRGVKASYAYTEGTAATEIISYAEANGCDLIAMATHGKGEVAWILGSVAERVVSHATVPVLLLRVMPMKPPVSKEDFMFKTFGPD